MKLDWNVDSSWTLFLDRDGVINERIFGGYILNKEGFIFKEGVLSVSHSLFSMFKYVIVVTNQQCIGKGLVSAAEVDGIHDFMQKELIRNHAKIDIVLVAPELKGPDSTLRKPSPKMAQVAKEKFTEIDFTKSIMVGDTQSDIEFGKNLEMKTVLIESDELCSSKPDLMVASLLELNQRLQ